MPKIKDLFCVLGNTFKITISACMFLPIWHRLNIFYSICKNIGTELNQS